MEKNISIVSGLGSGIVLLLACASSASADIAKLITQAEKQPNTVSVIIPVASSPDDNYGLLTMPTSDFAQQMQLTDPTQLENAYFQIVDDETSATLPVTDFDGDDVLYHLMTARSYYAGLAANADFPDTALQNKIIVRVRVDHGYNLVTHFAQWNDYDNSRYIPASFPGDTYATWNQEIWFDASKSQLTGVNWYNIAVSAGLAAASQSWVSLSATPLEIIDGYNAGIDASKQPGVIYHEAFHYSSDAPGIFPMASEGNPVAEDYANYFAASILGRCTIADLMEYSGRYYKRNYCKISAVKDTKPLYDNYNSVPFGPSVMWQIRELLGQQRADQMIWNSLKYINGTFLTSDEQTSLSSAAHADTALTADEVSKIDALLTKYHQSYVNLELKANPGELQLIDEQAAQASANKVATTDAEKQAAAEPGFRGKVISALNDIFKGIETGIDDTGKVLGYSGSAIFAAGNAPVEFGTDLATGIALGKGMISQGDNSVASEAVGAAGGIASVYYAYVGLDALGYSFADPAISVSYGGVMLNQLICNDADPNGITALDKYCVENSKIMSTIEDDTAKGGAKIGDAIHNEVVRIKNFFEGLFKKKSGDPAPDPSSEPSPDPSASASPVPSPSPSASSAPIAASS